MKEVYRNDDVIAYSGFRDAFGNKIFAVVNTTLNELRLYGLNKDYKKRRKALDEAKCKHVIIPKYSEVIDINKATFNKLEQEFPNMRHTQHWQVWE